MDLTCNMSSREIIKRIIRHQAPPRIGFDFLGENPSDFLKTPTVRLVHPVYGKYSDWGRNPELCQRVPGFTGEVKMTAMGNIFGRFDEKTQGECIKGALQDGWELLEAYTLPEIDRAFNEKIAASGLRDADKYVLGSLPFAVFSALRDTRHMDQALADTLLEPEYVTAFLEKTCALAMEIIDRSAENGFDGMILYDDLGMQHSMFMSKASFVALLKPFYKRIADRLHEHQMDLFVHSCGKVTELIPEFIDAGVNVFQFDQPELHGVKFLAETYGTRAAFYSPVDIQKVMPTGDPELIRRHTADMVNTFKAHGGSLIVMDYGNWQDIDVKPQWQQWARDTAVENCMMGR